MSNGIPGGWMGVLDSATATCEAELKGSAQAWCEEAGKACPEHWWELKEGSRLNLCQSSN